MERYQSQSDLLILFRKYLEGTVTPDEKQLVEALYDQLEQEADVLDSVSPKDKESLENRMQAHLYEHLHREIEMYPALEEQRWWKWWWGTAAAALFVIGVGVAYLSLDRADPVLPIVKVDPVELKPGGDHAILMLSDGSHIKLDDVSTGVLARQGGMEVHKLEPGLVAYSGTENFVRNQFNTIVAPTGGKYSVVLPDGSRIWLNAESSIKFPTAFARNERRVSISGEVYFEVAHDKQRPFFVDIQGQQSIKVLGTHFNVNAYKDEAAITTTLLEGSVVVSPGNSMQGMVRLNPGEQASLSNHGTIRVEKDVNTERAIAWKNGYFQFEKSDIKTVMRHLSRWYNVEISYEGIPSDKTFSGKIARSSEASEVLEILEFTGVHFRVERNPSGIGRKRIVVTTP
jgi:transmembrane sensor